MGQITSSVGLVSGINTGAIIDGLMSLESAPKLLLQKKIDTATQQKLAYTDLQTRLTSLRISSQSFEKASDFQAASAASSDQNTLTATAANGAAVGTYSFQVAQLVTSQQSISAGFADPTSAKIGAGSITIEMGGGELSPQTTLASLNGGAGVHRGKFRITDRSGASTVIDTTAAVNVDDVLKKINTSLDVQIQAKMQGDRIVLTDSSGKNVSNLIVQDLAGGSSAADLGLVGSTNSTTLTGSDTNYLARTTSLDQLNDGRGVSRGTTGNDFTISLADNTQVGVNLSAAKNIGDVLDAINLAGGGKIVADVPAGGNGIRLTDKTSGATQFKVTAAPGSLAAADLGLLTAASGSRITGHDILAGIDTTLLSSLRGGSGLSLGTVQFTDRNGGTAAVNFSGANNVQDIIDRINNASVGLKASLKDSGNGIQIQDTTGGNGNIVIADNGGGQTAQQLGIVGSFNTATPAVNGANLQKQWVTGNTLLSGYNGGQGVGKGHITITNAAGVSSTIDLSGSGILKMSDVISQINNNAPTGVTASINANGDGLLLTDTSTGASKLKVENVDGTTATDLNIAGTATTNTIDGSMEKTITVSANDTLGTVQQAINSLGFGVSATIINDGSGITPFRLSLTARNSGLAGRVTLDTGSTGLNVHNLVNAQDAAVFIGSPDSAQPLLVTASSNQVAGVIQGVTVSLHNVSTSPVTLTVSRNPDNVVQQMTDFTKAFNDMVDQMNTYTSFDATTQKAGLLLGDNTVQSIQANVYNMLNSKVTGAGRFKILADIGLTITDGAKLAFDENKFRAAFATDPDAVQNLFGQTQTVSKPDGTTSTLKLGIGYSFEAQINRLIDPVTGTLTQQSNTIDAQALQFQDQIKALDVLLTGKRDRLTAQFANMETILSNLQSQQSALSSLTNYPITTSTTTKKTN